ncbi:MAG: isochorismate synthase [Archangium sp.]
MGPERLSFYWSNPSRGLHVAALGQQADGDVEWIGGTPSSLRAGPRFGGWAFDSERAWSGFPSEQWFVPEVIAWWDGARTWLAAIAPTEEAARLRLERVREVEPPNHERGVACSRVGGITRDRWNTLITSALTQIDHAAFSKVVCARTIELRSEAAIDERAVLKSLEARHPQCFTFLVRGADGSAFVGSSPEMLCDVREGVWSVDALAGTAAAGNGAALLADDKERREHAAVVEWISNVVDSFSIEFSAAAQPEVKRLANVDHLHTALSGRLKGDRTALELARALHPTPAVAGTPQRAAIEWLRANEGFARGWYCGAVGSRGDDSLTLAVALRSALIRDREATIFVGAGVVKGSTPDREWLETERKANALLPAFGEEAQS